MSELILIVDDEDDLREIVRDLLEINGYQVIEARSAEEMYQQFSENEVSLVLLDIKLPGSDGLSALKKFRQEHNIPVVLLTGKGDVIDKVVGLELGADDYITKPFHSHELVARLKTVLRRYTKSTHINDGTLDNEQIVTFNGWKFDMGAQLLISPESEEVILTGHEFSILSALVKSAGTALSRDQLLYYVHEDTREYSPYDRSLDVMVAKIRKKLRDNPKVPKFIRTVRQTGYVFIANVSLT